MVKVKTKKALLDHLQKIDALEIAMEEIDKASSDSNKRQLLGNFGRLSEKFAKDQRDIILIAVKLK